MMDKLNIQKVCRTCILEHEHMLKVFSLVNCNGTHLSIAKILSSFSMEDRIEEIVERESIHLPNSICTKCTEQAIIAYNFKVLCERSRVFFENYVAESVNDENSTKLVVVDSLNNNVQNIEHLCKEESKTIEVDGNGSDHLSSTAVKPKEELLFGAFPDVNDSTDNDFEEGEESCLYFCKSCNKSFKNKYILTSHQKRHQLKGQFLCNVCGKGFSSQSCLNRHNRVHTGEKKYECKICRRKFPSSYNLNLHSRTHSGLKPYLCTVCGKKFSHPTGLTYHMRTHTNEKPYSCEACGKKFAIQCHFDRHRKIHSGERPFACSLCEKAFIKKIDLQRHEQIHSGLKPHCCAICNKSFLRKKNLNFHVMLHTEERPHVCPSCNKGFIRAYYLRDHIKKHHT